MTELSGFTPITPLAPQLPPQSLRIPTNRDAAIAAAAEILGAIWDAVDAELSPNVKIEVLRYNPPGNTSTTLCRITPVQPDGVANSVGMPGDWLCADTAGIRAMSNDAYAAMFTQNVPVEWAATATAPIVTAAEGLIASIAFPQPISANRPFSYVLNLTNETTKETAELDVVPVVDEIGNATIALDHNNLVDGDSYHATVTVSTQYQGVTATSMQTATFTAFDQPPTPPAPEPTPTPTPST